jgi:hypothetical protein
MSDVFLKTNKGRSMWLIKQNLPWMQIEMKSWTCLGRGKLKNLDFVIWTIAFKLIALNSQ